MIGLPLPQVPGEEEPALDAVFRTDDFRDRRAEDMPGVVEADRDTIVDRPVMPVGDGLEMGQRPLHVLAGEQRHNGVFPLSTLLAVPLPLVDGVFLLDPRGVFEDDLGQFARRGRGENRRPEPLADHPRQHAAVIDVGVGQQHRVDSAEVDRRVFPVPIAEVAFLVHAAVDEEPRTAGLEQMLRTGDLPVGAEKLQSHEMLSKLGSDGRLSVADRIPFRQAEKGVLRPVGPARGTRAAFLPVLLRPAGD